MTKKGCSNCLFRPEPGRHCKLKWLCRPPFYRLWKLCDLMREIEEMTSPITWLGN